MKKNRKAFSKSLKRTSKRTNNHPAATEAKATIRRNVLGVIGAPKASVFDAYAGNGEMFNKVWKDAGSYTGCDKDFYRDERECFVADNILVMRCIDLSQFNIFDLDAWGSPWEQAMIVADRRKIKKGEQIGLLLTEGSSLNLAFGGMARAFKQLAGITGRIGGAQRVQDELIERAIGGLCQRMGTDVVRQWQAKRTTGARMRYLGLVMQGAR